MVPDHWITSRAAAAILGFTNQCSVHHLVKRGYLRTIKTTYRYYFDPEEVKRLDEQGWPRRNRKAILSPHEYRYYVNNRTMLAGRRLRDRRDPRPFPETWIDCEEAARIAGITPNGIRMRRWRGNLPAVKWRRKLWFDPDVVRDAVG